MSIINTIFAKRRDCTIAYRIRLYKFLRDEVFVLLNYPLIAPPFDMKDFDEMNKGEAKQFFDWYISEIPSRLNVLEQLTQGKIELDFSPASLIHLFDWYLSVINLYKLSEEELEEIFQSWDDLPWFLYESEKESLLEHPYEIDQEDYALALDISIYFAETIRAHFPEVQWAYKTKPKSDAELNQPILLFETETIYYERNPRRLLLVIIEYIKKHDVTSKSLFDMFHQDGQLILGEDE